MLIMLPDFIRTQHWIYYITAGIAVYGIIICKVLERLTKPSKPIDERFFKALLNDKDLEEHVLRIPFHFTLRMAATMIIVTIAVMIFEFIMGKIVGDVGLFDVGLLVEWGPLGIAALAVFVYYQRP